MKKLTLLFAVVFFVAATSINAQITSAKSGDWSGDSTWVGGVVPIANSDVIIAAEQTVTLNTAATINNLTIRGKLQFNKTNAVNIVVNGDIVVESGASFTVQSRSITESLVHILELKGNLTHSGTTLDFRTGSSGSTLGVCNLLLTGSTNSTITINGNYSSSNGNFNAVTINKSGGAKVILGSDMYIDGGSSAEPLAQSILTFQNGLVETGDFALIHLTGTTANVQGASPASYVKGNMGRGMANSGGSTKPFDVGDEYGYRPVTVRSTTAGGATGHHIIVSAIHGNANTGTSTFAGEINKVSAVRYFKVTYKKGTTTTASMSVDKFSLRYGADDGVSAGNNNLRVAYSTDARATWNGFNQTVPHTTDLTEAVTTITPDSLATSWVLNDGASMYLALARVTGTTDNNLESTPPVSVSGTGIIPESYSLYQNYPNPFNPTTTIGFSIPKAGMYSLKVYNILGQEVANLFNKELTPDNYSIVFDGKELTSGIYIYRLFGENINISKKMILMK